LAKGRSIKDVAEVSSTWKGETGFFRAIVVEIILKSFSDKLKISFLRFSVSIVCN